MKSWALLVLMFGAIALTSAEATVHVSQPRSNSSVPTSVQFVASATSNCSKGVAAMGIYTAPFKLAYKVNGASLNTVLTLNAGTYKTVVQEWDRCGSSSSTPVTIQVIAPAGVSVKTPTNNAQVAPTVQYIATAHSNCSQGVAAMGIYTAPFKLAYKVSGSSLNTRLTLNPGTYQTVVQEWDKCGSFAKTPITIKVVASSTGKVPRSQHVWVVTEENHSYENVIGNRSMPYFNSLVTKFGLATQYYSNQHSSLPALMWLVAGRPVTTNNNTTSCFNVDNVVRHLLLHGLTWKSYQEDLPFAGFTGLSNANYVRRHNPLIDFMDVCAPSQRLHSVPYSQLSNDIASRATPNYAYITPNLQHDAHDGTLAQADLWLSQKLPKILTLPEFQTGGDGLLFVVWDEGNLNTDNRCSANTKQGCGGRVATLVIGPKVKKNFKSQVLYHHQDLLRTVCDALGFSSCPGAASTSKAMADFF